MVQNLVYPSTLLVTRFAYMNGYYKAPNTNEVKIKNVKVVKKKIFYEKWGECAKTMKRLVKYINENKRNKRHH